MDSQQGSWRIVCGRVTQFLTQLEWSWDSRRCPPLCVYVRPRPRVSSSDHGERLESTDVGEPPEPFMSTLDVSVMLGVTPTTVLRYYRAKRLVGYKISRRLIRFKRSDVEDFIRRRYDERGEPG